MTKLQCKHKQEIYYVKTHSENTKQMVYLVGAVEGHDIGLHLGLSLFRDSFIRARRLNRRTS